MVGIQFHSRHVLGGLLALFLLLPSGCKKTEEAAPEEEHAAPVKWEAAEKADLEEWTELLGTTQPLPNHVARVSAAVEGHVLSVLPSDKGKTVVEGQHVEKGQILVQLEDRILRAGRNKLVAGDAELKELSKQAGHAVEMAHYEIERLDRLQRSSGSSVALVTRIEIDKAQLALKDAESKFKAAQAKEEVAHAELKALDEQLALYTLRAPLSGQLGLVHAMPGQSLAIGATVAEIINLDEIDVLCFVPARTVNHLKLDQAVRVEDAEADSGDSSKPEEGRIVFISDLAQAETGTIAVKARFPNQKRKLRANTLLRVRVLTEKKTDCITIPEEALLEDQEEPAVLVVEVEKNEKGEEEHKVHKYQARLGLRDHEKHKVEILGLIDKDKKPVKMDKDTLFVVEGGHGLEDDDTVSLKKEEHEEHKEGEHKEDEKKEEKKDGEHKDDEKKDADHKEDKKKDVHK